MQHNDFDAFDQAIRRWQHAGGKGRPWIAVESLYSMDGDRAPVLALADVADRHEGFLVIDEAHATGVFGPGGPGLASELENRGNVLVLHETDSETVVRMGGVQRDRVLPQVYRLATPASPHFSARLDGIAIDPENLVPPVTDRPLIIEGAGGLLVPLSDDLVFADVFARWRIPVILCARTSLGTINHTSMKDAISKLSRNA
ncbi:dethiobiotin synthase [Rhizobium mongolense]|uniref:Dethiobiotin synthase n=1 Tax=Rhizobium mongolense TaxID=57676 RepID=A0ABR6IXE9_9HYPH|nr:dethiobiotin synthase [Rhizobium mongolense]